MLLNFFYTNTMTQIVLCLLIMHAQWNNFSTYMWINYIVWWQISNVFKWHLLSYSSRSKWRVTRSPDYFGEQMFPVPVFPNFFGEQGNMLPFPKWFYGNGEHVPIVPMNLGELFTNIGEHVHQLTGFKVSVVSE